MNHSGSRGRRGAETHAPPPHGPSPADEPTPAVRAKTTTRYDGLILEAVPFTCLCAAHHRPFIGRIHIGYVPDRLIAAPVRVAGLLERLCRSPRTQQQLTAATADAFVELLNPSGAAVLIRAEHSCMPGPGPVMITLAWRGSLCELLSTREEFLRLTQLP